MSDIPWSPHPVEAIEALFASRDADALAAALSHPAIQADPYARLRILDRLHALQPGNVHVELHRLQALLLGNRPARAWQAISRWPDERFDDPALGLLAAQTAHTLGLDDEACALFARLAARHPDSIDILQKQVEFDPRQVDASLESRLEALHRHDADPYVREKAGFALATACQAHDLPRAFDLARAAHRLKRMRTGAWDVRGFRSALADDRQWPARPEAASNHGAGRRHLFVVGAPRSGTTLASSLLGRHPGIANIGEQNLVGALANGPARGAGARDDARLPRFAAAWYDAATADMAGAAAVTLDKLPSNAERCGLLQALLGDALVLHVHRDPRDCALSIHLHDFEHGLAYSSALDDIARYLHLLDAHMAHFEARLPGRIMRIGFEALVEAPEATLSPVLERLGLSWTPDMLDFWRDGEQPGTFSAAQVRQPLNRRGIGRWQRLGDAAGPLLQALAAATD